MDIARAQTSSLWERADMEGREYQATRGAAAAFTSLRRINRGPPHTQTASAGGGTGKASGLPRCGAAAEVQAAPGRVATAPMRGLPKRAAVALPPLARESQLETGELG